MPKAVFGLEAQGHIPTIEAILEYWNGDDNEADMKFSKFVWEKIGEKIGWCPFTAALHYFRYLEKKHKV